MSERRPHDEARLEDAFRRYDGLVEAEVSDGGCEHTPAGDDGVCWHCRQRMFVLTLLPVLTLTRDDGVTECARYVAGHYPVQITERDGPSRWEMDEDADGGRLQTEYAKALLGLKGGQR